MAQFLRAAMATAAFAAGLASAAWADSIAELQQKIDRTQVLFDSRLAEYNAALRTVSERQGEVESALTVLGLRKNEMEAALEKLRKAQKLIRE